MGAPTRDMGGDYAVARFAAAPLVAPDIFGSIASEVLTGRREGYQTGVPLRSMSGLAVPAWLRSHSAPDPDKQRGYANSWASVTTMPHTLVKSLGTNEIGALVTEDEAGTAPLLSLLDLAPK